MSVLDFEKQERAKEVAVLEKAISGRKEELQDIQIQQIKVVRETEQIRQELSELFATNDLLREQTETLAQDKEKLLSDNEKLEQQQKKLQQEIGKMVISKTVMERNIRAYDEDKEWQLPEAGAFMSAKTYRDKKALSLVEWLKDVIKRLTIKCIQLMEQVKKLTAKINRQGEKIEYLTDRVMEQRTVIDSLQEQATDLGCLKRYFGEERVQSIVEQTKALERAEKVSKRPRRSHEMIRQESDIVTDMEKKIMVQMYAKILLETDLYDTDIEVRNLIGYACRSR